MDSYTLRVLDRAARTALQVTAGYLITGHTIGGVDWRTAGLAAGLAVVVSLLQGLISLPVPSWLGVWGDVLGRSVRTASQTALGSLGASAVLLTDVRWPTVGSAAVIAAATSVVTSLIALPLGPVTVEGTTDIVGPDALPHHRHEAT